MMRKLFLSLFISVVASHSAFAKKDPPCDIIAPTYKTAPDGKRTLEHSKDVKTETLTLKQTLSLNLFNITVKRKDSGDTDLLFRIDRGYRGATRVYRHPIAGLQAWDTCTDSVEDTVIDEIRKLVTKSVVSETCGMKIQDGDQSVIVHMWDNKRLLLVQSATKKTQREWLRLLEREKLIECPKTNGPIFQSSKPLSEVSSVKFRLDDLKTSVWFGPERGDFVVNIFKDDLDKFGTEAPKSACEKLTNKRKLMKAFLADVKEKPSSRAPSSESLTVDPQTKVVIHLKTGSNTYGVQPSRHLPQLMGMKKTVEFARKLAAPDCKPGDYD